MDFEDNLNQSPPHKDAPNPNPKPPNVNMEIDVDLRSLRTLCMNSEVLQIAPNCHYPVR